mmetsp:Transcript_31572/g.84352  ORF Transcript_31572/g.84352 Transcript_31572/m.84352 type:complete len:300 (-) Transcript_31572:424-1323(-)
MDAKVVYTRGKIWSVLLRRGHIQPRLLRQVTQLDHHHGENRFGLLPNRQHVRSQLHEVRLHCSSSNVHDILRESNAPISTSVLLLKDALVRVVVIHLSATCVLQFVLCPAGIGEATGQDQGHPSTSEERVLQQHGFILPKVKTLGEVLCGNYEGASARSVLNELLCQVHRDNIGGATHAAQIVAPNVRSHLKVVCDHGADRRSRHKEGAVYDQEVHVPGRETSFVQNFSDDGKDDVFHLLSRHRDTWLHLRLPVLGCDPPRRPMRCRPCPRTFQHPREEFLRVIIEGTLTSHDAVELVM